MSSRYKRSKEYGYEVEKAALRALRRVFPTLTRTGSMAYKKDAADLVQNPEATTHALRLVITRDKRRPMLVTLDLNEFTEMLANPTALAYRKVMVQVKGRTRTWIGSLYAGLVDATK